MNRKDKFFARFVLAIHLLLLILVIGLVLAAARAVFNQARQESLAQAASSQELLAEQTADGIETFYQSIRADLDLLHRADDDDDNPTSQPATRPAAVPAPTQPFIFPALPLANPLRIAGNDPFPGGAAGRTKVAEQVGFLLWRQLDRRVTLLFSVDADRLERDKTLKPGNTGTIRVIGPVGSYNAARTVVEEMRDWIRKIDRPTVSRFRDFGDLGPGIGRVHGNLVCVPALERPTDKGRRFIVAVVPIQEIQSRFLDKINARGNIGNNVAATLTGSVEDAMVTMVSSDPQLIGIDALRAEDPNIRDLAQHALGSDRAVTINIEKPYSFGSVHRQPRMMTMVPVNIMGKRWYLMISSRLAQVDAIVDRVFRKALYWSIFVVIAMTGVLVSTSVWIIRGRARLERVQHEILTKELNQAREIQKAWLPQRKLTFPHVDISAVNTPASHISGDFYNWFELPDGRLVVIIGDVTGHGMSAAFLMATTQLLVRSAMMRVGDPGLCLDDVNRELCTQIFVGQFVTLLIVVLDQDNDRLQVGIAGHYPPLVSDGEAFQSLKMEPQMVLGVDPDETYRTEEFALPRGANVVLYTDGILDVESASGQRFRSEGLRRTLTGKFDSAQSLIDALLTNVDAFRGEMPLPDDLTLVAIQRVATPSRRTPAAAAT